MIEKIKEKIHIALQWVKDRFKKLLITLGIVGVAIASGVVLQPEQIPFAEAEGQTISFPHTDENKNENFIIRTDKQTYDIYGKETIDVYVMVENKSGKGQIADIQFYFPRETITVNKISRMSSGGSYQFLVEDFATTTITDSTTSEKIVVPVKIGEHYEERFGNVWQEGQITGFSQEHNALLLSKGRLVEKEKPNQLADKKIQVPILNQGISYFKVNIGIPPLHREEFYIEVVGSEGGYGLLDPTLFESQTLANSVSTFYEPYDWFCTFTPAEGHTITSAFFKMHKAAGQDPGTMTVYVQAVDASHHPTGATLASGTYDLNTLGTDAAGTRFEVSFGAGTLLAAGTEYGFYGEAPTSNSTKWYRINSKNTNVYAGGFWGYTTGDHSGWGDYTTYDMYFEDWGTTGGAAEETQMEIQLIE